MTGVLVKARDAFMKAAHIGDDPAEQSRRPGHPVGLRVCLRKFPPTTLTQFFRTLVLRAMRTRIYK